jgi:hypothetical protein
VESYQSIVHCYLGVRRARAKLAPSSFEAG